MHTVNSLEFPTGKSSLLSFKNKLGFHRRTLTNNVTTVAMSRTLIIWEDMNISYITKYKIIFSIAIEDWKMKILRDKCWNWSSIYSNENIFWTLFACVEISFANLISYWQHDVYEVIIVNFSIMAINYFDLWENRTEWMDNEFFIDASILWCHYIQNLLLTFWHATSYS